VEREVLISLVSCDRTKGTRSKLCQGAFRLYLANHCFTEKVVKHLNRLPREVVNAPCCQHLRGIWTMPLLIGFNCGSALKRTHSGTR